MKFKPVGYVELNYDSKSVKFNIGDKNLIGFDFNLSEGKNSTSCKIEVFDPKLELADAMFKNKVTGGIIKIVFEFIEFQFIHIGVDYNLSGNSLNIFGQSNIFNLSKSKTNLSFTNVSLKQIINEFVKDQNVVLDMDEDSIFYDYIPLVGISRWNLIVNEIERRGYYVSIIPGNPDKLKVKSASQIIGENKDYELAPNINTKFSYKAETSNDGDRSSSSSKKSNVTETKKTINLISGQIVDTGAGKIYKDTEKNISGSHILPINPIYKDENVKNQDSINRANKLRIEGINLNTELPCSQELLLLVPTDTITTVGYSANLNRKWLLKSIRHSFYSDGYKTSIEASTPSKDKIK